MNDSDLLKELQLLYSNRTTLADDEQRRDWLARAAALVEHVSQRNAAEIRQRAQVLSLPVSRFMGDPAWSQAQQIVRDVIAGLEAGALKQLSQEHSVAKVESNEVQVARITARQAIIVAVITAVPVILAAFLTGYRSAPRDNRQHWVTLKPLVAERDSDGSAVRVVALANSQAYSYPSRAVWADVGPRMSRESFPLPVGVAEFRVRFEVFLRRPDGQIVQYTSQDVHEIKVAGLEGSFEREYPVFPLDQDFVRGASEESNRLNSRLAIAYEIR